MNSQDIKDVKADTETFSNAVHASLDEVRKRAEQFADQGQLDHGMFEETDGGYVLMNENDRLSFKIQLYENLLAEQHKVRKPDTDALPHLRLALEAEKALIVARAEDTMKILMFQALEMADSKILAQWEAHATRLAELGAEVQLIASQPYDEAKAVAAYQQVKSTFKPAYEGRLSKIVEDQLMALEAKNPRLAGDAA